MPHVAVTAVGADRPGIVAAVTKVLVESGCNLEDTSMTILRGHFAMMLVVDTPTGTTPEQLEQGLAAPAGELDLVITVRPIDEAVTATPTPGDLWTVSVYGADRPGIVHGVADMLAGLGINIVDLTTRVVGTPQEPVYAMLLDVTIPEGQHPREMGIRLAELASELGVECSMNPSDADIL